MSTSEETSTANDNLQDVLSVDNVDSSNGAEVAPDVSYEGDFDISPLEPSDFEEDDLRRVHRTMLTSRLLDEKMLTLLKQGQGFFHIGCAGHEAAQAAVGLYSRSGEDWFCMYYRDLCMTLMMGMTIKETLLAHLAKADDPNSGGRQMAEHFGLRDRHVMTTSSSVGSQFLPGLGFAMSIMRRGTDQYTYTSCGDGATSQGGFHEALNWSARIGAPQLFFVQDNKYAISVPVSQQTAGGTAYKLAAGYEGIKRMRVDGTDFFQTASAAKTALDHIRGGNGPVCLVADVVRLLPHSSSDNHTKYRTPEELEKDQQIDPIARMEFKLADAGVLRSDEAQSIRHEVKSEIDEAAKWAKRQADPSPETATRYVYFEGDYNFDFEKTPLRKKKEKLVMVDAINQALHEEMERCEEVIVYGEDVAGEKGGVFTATRNLTNAFGDDRCFNSPLAEASIIGTAVGLAASGFRPVIEIQFADYIWPGMQQLRNQVAPLRYRSNNAWSCPMVIRVPCGGYIHGGLCHSQNVESIFGHFPGLRVVFPSTAADAKGLLKSSIRMEDPVIFLEHKGLYRAAAARTDHPDEEYLLPFGKARIHREGTDLSIISYGMMVHKSMSVARELAKEGIDVEIIDLRTINPVDSEALLASVRKTNRALVVYEDHEFIGFGAEISAQIADLAFEHLDAPVQRVAGAFSFVPFADPLEKAVLPSDQDIMTACRQILSY